MMSFWNSLPARERRTLLLGALALAGIAFYALLWEPLGRETQRLQQHTSQQQALLAWMQDAAARLQQAPAEQVAAADLPPLLAVERSLEKTALAGSIKRRQPDGENRVRLWLEGVPFDALPAWLARLEGDFGLTVRQIRIDPTDAPGRVDAQITLDKAAS